MTYRDPVDALCDELDRALARQLPPEHREMLADALVVGADPGTAPLPPGVRETAATFAALLDQIEERDGAEERRNWALSLAGDLTVQTPVKRLEEMSSDELERYVEWREKYPDAPP